MAWRRIEEDVPQALVSLHIEGRPVQARADDSVAVAMLAAGVAVFRETPVSGAPRAPLCMMGVCFECLVEIDNNGGPNRTFARGVQQHRERLIK